MATTLNDFAGTSYNRRSSDHLLPSRHTNAPPGRFFTEVVPAIPPIEAWIDTEDNEYHLSIAVPGLDPNDLQLHIEGRNLTVHGEQQPQTRSRDTQYLQREFNRQRLHRTIALPDSVDSEKVTARYSNGILEITAPLKESATSKRIQITAGAQTKGAGA
jgi:HSP20 family protein